MKVLAEITDEGYPNYDIDTIKMTFYDEKTGLRRIKYVSVESFASAIRAGVYSKGNCRIGELPTGYYDASIGEDDGFACAAILVLPRRVQRIIYMDTQYEMEMPALVFAFEVKKCKVVQTRVFCVKDEEPSPESILYRFPLGNVSNSSGRVCWGNNPLPKVKGLKDLEKIMTCFLTSPFNSDHYQVNTNCKLHNFNLRDLCEYVQTEGKFCDEEILMPVSTNGYRTLGELQKALTL